MSAEGDPKPEIQKWEYCFLEKIGDHNLALNFTKKDGLEIVELKEKTKNYNQILGNTISELGENGWEMVGCGNTGEHTHKIYFKRPKT